VSSDGPRLCREVPPPNLYAAMCAVLQHQHEQAGLGPVLEFEAEDPEALLNDFLLTCSMRQLRLLREIAESFGIMVPVPPFPASPRKQ
jgi:hypothetical protein